MRRYRFMLFLLDQSPVDAPAISAGAVDRGGRLVSQRSRSPHRAARRGPSTPVPSGRGNDNSSNAPECGVVSGEVIRSGSSAIEKSDQRGVECVRGLPEHPVSDLRQDRECRSGNCRRDLPRKARRSKDIFLTGDDVSGRGDRTQTVARVKWHDGVALASRTSPASADRDMTRRRDEARPSSQGRGTSDG